MTDGPEYSRHRRSEDDSSWQQDESEDAMGDVLDRFTFNSKRPRRRHREDARGGPAGERRRVPREGAQPRRPPPPPPGDVPPSAAASDAASSDAGPAPRLDENAAFGEPAAAEQDAVAASSVRSYAWTGGRTRSNFTFELETLVSTGEAFRPGPMVRHEHQFIAELCQHPRSVAEVGALLGVPVGVVKVLLADMAELGWITVHQTVTDGGSAPHLMLMERVLSGLRRL